MLLNLIYLLSALVAVGLLLLTEGGIGLALAVFVGCTLLCLLICFLIIWVAAKRSDPEKEHTEDDPFIRAIIKYYAPAVFRLLGCKIEVTGAEKLPRDSRFLLVSNHLADLDPGIFFTAFPDDQLSFIAKKEVAQMPIIGILMRRILCQFVNRENDREALKTILKCIQILKEDKASVAVFPEGGILSEDGKLHHFRPGVFKIAQKANVPIVVCTLKNTMNVIPNLLKWKPSHVEMNVLAVIPPEEIKGVTTVDIADRCYKLMAADLGPDLIAE